MDFSLGLERTGGFETVAFCEIEPFPRRVLAKHWPEVPCYEDVRELTAARLVADGIAGVDVITGGFPCQDVSASGHQRGMDGTRSGLWSEIIRLVGELEPQFVLVENVTNLLNGGSGAWFGRVLGDLAKIGYDAEWHCIPAAYVGLPHSRDRVWIIAYPESIGRICLDADIKEGRKTVYLENIGERWAATVQILPSVGELYAKPSSDIGRNDDGLSCGLDRLKAVGNAVVPQIPELIGRAILQSKGPVA